jgi:nucleotide-binding universal stress UspA family protein
VTVADGGGDRAEPAVADRRQDVGASRQHLLIVGVDGSPAAVAALEWALEQARLDGGRVVAVAVSEPPPAVTTTAGLANGFLVPAVIETDQMTAAAEERLSDAIASLPVQSRHAVERQVAHGDPATVLLDAARDADMLVLGNHGRGAIASAVLGSVAQHCAHHAECPLVLVPTPRS